MKKIHIYMKFLLIPLLVFLISANNFAGGDKSGKNNNQNRPLEIKGDAYRMFINNLDVPMNKTGVLGDVSVGIGGGTAYSGGQIDGVTFLYSGGFYMSGQTNGLMWANAVASASRVQDYVAGTTKYGRNDSRNKIYIVRQTDGDFSDSWEEWKAAVALGAYFYDGDGDGNYNPVDLNGNGKWDPTEDRPDLLGDETVWCVYSDGVDAALRRFNDVDPQGIDVRQTVFAFNSKGVVGNMLFVRYSILNTGSVADVMDSVYFGVWADPDLGDAYDDLVGCDVSLNAGFVYNDKDDQNFGINPPCFLIDFFQGPIAYVPGESFTDVNSNGVYDAGVDIPLDTAHNVQGQVRGIGKYPGATNLGLSSFVHYMQSDPRLGDPNTRFEARNYMIGQDKIGGQLDPCTWAFGTVKPGGVPCGQLDKRYWYSGDPVKDTGWINNTPKDQRLMLNTGPFKLEKGKPVDIVAAYVVARGTNALNSITKTKEYDKVAQIVFDANFPSPPPPPPVQATAQTGDGFIALQWSTNKQVSYKAVDTVLDIDRRFKGYYVTAYKTNSKQDKVNGIVNSKEMIFYDLADSIVNIYAKYPHGGTILLRSEAENKLDSALYADPTTGRIRFVIDKDPFTDEPLIKGHEYYFTVTTYTLNHRVMRVKGNDTLYGPKGDYMDLNAGGGMEEFETAIIKVVYGDNEFSPQVLGASGESKGSYNDGAVTYLVVEKDKLTGDQYKVEFFKDSLAPFNDAYKPFWRLKNITKNTTLIDSSKNYDYDTTMFAGKVVEGFIPKVKEVTPTIGLSSSEVTYTPNANIWYDKFATTTTGVGVYYVGYDIPQGSSLAYLDRVSTARSNVITADKLRKIEIRFGTTGKAYRYLNGYKGNFITYKTFFTYAEGVKSADTTGRGAVGNWDAVNDRANGFVDVPFTAWVVDDKLKETYQLAVGFIEASEQLGGNPDGNWDPGDSLALSYELIAIFDAPYDATGSQWEYTGKYSGSTQYADIIKGWTVADTTLPYAQRRIAKSPWFNSMYVVGLSKLSPSKFYTSGDKMTIPVTTYPYNSSSNFVFKTKLGGDLTETERKELFNKVNVFPNPLFAYNPATSYNASTNPDDAFVTFSNLPTDVTIKIFTLSGTLIRTLTTTDKSSPTSPFLRWDLQNQDGLRVASGMYLAIVSAPGYGEKILKFAIIMPQKQIQRF